jgi:hypothetical protein
VLVNSDKIHTPKDWISQQPLLVITQLAGNLHTTYSTVHMAFEEHLHTVPFVELVYTTYGCTLFVHAPSTTTIHTHMQGKFFSRRRPSFDLVLTFPAFYSTKEKAGTPLCHAMATSMDQQP